MELNGTTAVVSQRERESFNLVDRAVIEINLVLLLVRQILEQNVFRIGLSLNLEFHHFILI